MANKNLVSWLWHKKLGHASMSVLNRLVKLNLVNGLPKIKFIQDKICDVCARGKQKRNSFKPKHVVSTFKSFDLVHMDLFGPTRTLSISGKRFGLVIVDDYSRFTWVCFLLHKSEAFDKFILPFRRIQTNFRDKITAIQTDHGEWSG